MRGSYKQLRAGEETLRALLKDWVAITSTTQDDAYDGDAVRRPPAHAAPCPRACSHSSAQVRRRVGTVGVSSPLFGLSKVLRKVGDDLEARGELKGDFIDFIERLEDVQRRLSDVDAYAYSAIFSDASGNAGRKTEGSRAYLEKSRVATEALLKDYTALLTMLPGV